MKIDTANTRCAFGVADTRIRLHKAEGALNGVLPGERAFAEAARYRCTGYIQIIEGTAYARSEPAT